MTYKGVLFFLGIYSLFVSFFSFLNILYSIYFNFILDLNSYIISLIISLSVGTIFCLQGRKYSKNISKPNHFEPVGLSIFRQKWNIWGEISSHTKNIKKYRKTKS